MTLTDEGRRLLAEASDRAAVINQAMIDALGPDLADALALGLSRCIGTLEGMPDMPGVDSITRLPHALRALALGRRGHRLRHLGHFGIPRPFQASTTWTAHRTETYRP